jgi:amidophosphoribosyltransferase
MGGFFGVVSKENCIVDLFFGTDYHSHLGNQRGGMLVWGKEGGLQRSIHDITNAQFRSKFQDDVERLNGEVGIGSISDTGDQPLIVFSRLGTYGITTVGVVNNLAELSKNAFRSTRTHFCEMTGDGINPTEMVASLISLGGSFAEGFKMVHDKVQGSCSMLLLVKDGVYAVRDRLGRTPVVIGEKEGSYAATLETSALYNLGYRVKHWLGPGEAVLLTRDGMTQILPPRDRMQICTFLWVYYGFPASSYEGINVENTRYRCGAKLAERDSDLVIDGVAGVPDSGTAHALGYANASCCQPGRTPVPYKRAFVKYTPTWPRSFIPSDQITRNQIAKMKLLPIEDMIRGQRLLFCEDSIVRGTQLRETFKILKQDMGAREVHVRCACPPIMFNCKFLNFSQAHEDMALISRRAIFALEGDCNSRLSEYCNDATPCYQRMVEEIRSMLNLTSLKYQKLDDLIEAIGLPREKLCTYCWDGKE